MVKGNLRRAYLEAQNLSFECVVYTMQKTCKLHKNDNIFQKNLTEAINSIICDRCNIRL